MLKSLMPKSEHRLCVKHMYDNYKVVFKGLEYKKKLWSAAWATTKKTWEVHMTKLKEMDQTAYDWVMKHDPYTWSRSHFSEHTKSNALQNNISESFNSYIKYARNLPILSMFEWIRRRLTKRFYVKLNAMKNYKGDICPNAQEELAARKIESRNCFCTLVGNNKYEVDFYGTQNTIHLANNTCSSRVWDLMGLPCKHAVSCIFYNKEIPEMYMHKYFSKNTYVAMYNHVINPIPSKEELEHSNPSFLWSTCRPTDNWRLNFN